MTHLTDFGPKSNTLNHLVSRMVMVGVVATFAIATVWELASERSIIARSTTATHLAAIAGPPCPALTPAAAQGALRAQGLRLGYVFDFNGDTFGRAFGHADCSVATARGSLGLGSYDVCQFTSPDIVSATTPRGTFYFQPGVGQKATVMTPDGVARCIEAAPAWND